MTPSLENSPIEFEAIKRHPDGRIPASRRYIDYDGQLVIRTRYATIQRWKSSGWDPGRMGDAPHMLEPHYCTGDSDTLNAKNDHLEANQFEVYYVEDGERVYYEVANGQR